MTPLTSEWTEKAEGDYHSALRELRARKHPNHDAACFHAQQCAEKYLKGRLQEDGTRFKKTHIPCGTRGGTSSRHFPTMPWSTATRVRPPTSRRPASP